MEGMGASGSITKQIAADLRSVESGRQMSGLNVLGGRRERDSDKCGAVVLIVARCHLSTPWQASVIYGLFGDCWAIECAQPLTCV